MRRCVGFCLVVQVFHFMNFTCMLMKNVFYNAFKDICWRNICNWPYFSKHIPQAIAFQITHFLYRTKFKNFKLFILEAKQWCRSNSMLHEMHAAKRSNSRMVTSARNPVFPSHCVSVHTNRNGNTKFCYVCHKYSGLLCDSFFFYFHTNIPFW